LISVEAWKEIGPYRDDYFMYCEDVEWCERARKAGWKCLYVGEVLCWHAGSATAATRGELSLTPTSAYYVGRNSMRFALETRNLALRASRIAGVATIWAAHNARRLRGAPPKTVQAYIEGLRDAFSGRMGPRAREKGRQDCPQ
jgi:GT2 family glycosyltransferase